MMTRTKAEQSDASVIREMTYEYGERANEVWRVPGKIMVRGYKSPS